MILDMFGFFYEGGRELPNGFYLFGLQIRFYALFILTGALLALFLSSYHARKRGYPWDVFDLTFILAFPAGIIGARIWFVIAEWATKFGPNFASDPFAMFRMWEGGLAIQGGVIGGVLVGVLTVVLRRKGMDPLEACDFVIPTILIAQAIGRWGNFFNGEVYGQYVSEEAYSFLPNFIINNMPSSSSNIAVPLFIIEALINIGGYFILARGLKTVFKNHLKNGDMAFSYFIFYGLVRALLEPLRNAQYIMGGENNMKSFYMAIAFVIGGVLAIVANHLIRHYLTKKKEA